MSPTLDHGELREIRAHADELGMYCESGLGKVNPYASPEAPELRAIGDGDILLGFERMLRGLPRDRHAPRSGSGRPTTRATTAATWPTTGSAPT